MFDPQEVGARMAPGDKISMSFHKAKAEPGGGFIDHARAAGLVPGGGHMPAPSVPAVPASAAPVAAMHMPQMSAVSRPAVPVDHRSLLVNALRRRLMTPGR